VAIIPKQFYSTINIIPVSLSYVFYEYSVNNQYKNICMDVLSINCIQRNTVLCCLRNLATYVSSDLFLIHVWLPRSLTVAYNLKCAEQNVIWLKTILWKTYTKTWKKHLTHFVLKELLNRTCTYMGSLQLEIVTWQ